IQDQGFFRNLLKDSTGVLDILSGGFGHAGNVIIPDLPYPVKNEPFVKFVHNKHGVFMSLDATGRIYQVKDNEPDLDLIRKDSTIFFGYNFGAYFFTHNDTLFSYGGYGYWNINGHLRYFNYDQAEWELMPLSKEITGRKGDADFSYNSWFDQSKGSLYVLKSTSHPDSVYVLDMRKKEWSTVGKRVHSQDLSYFISSPWGLICMKSDTESSPQYLLLDFYNNSISTLNGIKTAELTASIYPNFKAYIKDSTLSISKRFEPTEVVNIRLSKTDFEPTGEKIYEPLPIPSNTNTLVKFAMLNWYVIVALGGVFIAGVLLGKRSNRRIIPSSKPFSNSSGNTRIFDSKEMDLVKLILSKSKLNQTASIDEINRILGISEKSPDMQKKHRSDIINSINNKYRLVSGDAENLLTSKRSVPDKRSFEYLIKSDKINEIEKLFIEAP
ncbi:MAG: hypothetical protein RI909_1972, partial [Bacteroidota bacterium]